ncbi:MAG: hypothetical protein ACREFP_16070 [Acetobacteraceae bacterium]
MRFLVPMAGFVGALVLVLGLASVAPSASAQTGSQAPPEAAGSGATAAPSRTAVPLPPPAAPGPAIIGFRSARFGMTEAAVRAAIADDFRLPSSAVRRSQNPVDRTTILAVRVADLAPGTGRAVVSYVFGYRSHALIEVNIVWSKAGDPHLTPEQLTVIGARLQAYFSAEGFPRARSAINVPLPDGLLLFRTIDAAGRAIALVLSGSIKNEAKSGKRVLTPTALSLAYAVDAAHPDVFRLKKGSF